MRDFRYAASILVGLLFVCAASSVIAADGLVLERVVLVQRHGVRPPTQSADALAHLSSRPWPQWSVAPGELTPHGAQTVRLMGSTLRLAFAGAGLLPASGCAAPGAIAIYADGADQRTRESGNVLAESLAPGCHIDSRHGPDGETDPLFDSSDVCLIDADRARAAILEVLGASSVETPKVRGALSVLQSIVAPDGCVGGAGVCLSGDSQIVAGKAGVKIQGPTAVGATLAENFLLEYSEGLSPAEVGWGQAASEAAIAAVMPVHEREADLTRRTPYIATRRGSVMARAILAALSGDASPYFGKDAKVIAFAGHDTNLSNMAGVFGLDWSLPDQPDSSAPATTLAFELWRVDKTGERFVKPVLFYESLNQLRTLSPVAGISRTLPIAYCADDRGCAMSRLRETIEARLPKDCSSPPLN